MEKKIEIHNIPKELKGREKIYYDALTTKKFPRLRIPSLKAKNKDKKCLYTFSKVLQIF